MTVLAVESLMQPGDHAPSLLDLLAQRPAWMRDALCREPAYAGVEFFPEGSDIGPAQAVCGRCLVADECRRYADAITSTYGIWGGLSASERRRARREGS